MTVTSLGGMPLPTGCTIRPSGGRREETDGKEGSAEEQTTGEARLRYNTSPFYQSRHDKRVRLLFGMLVFVDGWR